LARGPCVAFDVEVAFHEIQIEFSAEIPDKSRIL
jgi:hypothetical protein